MKTFFITLLVSCSLIPVVSYSAAAGGDGKKLTDAQIAAAKMGIRSALESQFDIEKIFNAIDLKDPVAVMQILSSNWNLSKEETLKQALLLKATLGNKIALKNKNGESIERLLAILKAIEQAHQAYTEGKIAKPAAEAIPKEWSFFSPSTWW